MPEATTVDDATLQQLVAARAEDLYLSPISPLGVPFNALCHTSNEVLKNERAGRGKPGSPCLKRHLVSNTEFTAAPICTASRQYQRRKLEQLQARHPDPRVYEAEAAKVLARECLCEGLANAALQRYHLGKKTAAKAVSICPGPNLAYFSATFTLQQMTDHIYGRFNALNDTYRPHMFVNELRMYVDYWKKQLAELPATPTGKQLKYVQSFRDNLMQGIGYYKQLLPVLFKDRPDGQHAMQQELQEAAGQLQAVVL